MVTKSKLTKKEIGALKKIEKDMRKAEMQQFYDLDTNCNISFQYAKTYTVYKKDWLKTRKTMEERIESGDTADRPELAQEMVNIYDRIIEEKLKKAERGFENKFGELIFNYINQDGTTKGCSGALLIFAIPILYLIIQQLV